MSRLLTNEFINQYRDKEPPMTEMGEFVYYRTYSRWLEDEERREQWLETVRRAVEYNVGLDTKTETERLREEAEQLFDNIFNLRQTVAGRTLWVGETEVADKFPLANFNCAFLVLDDFDDFKELFYLLMVGVGVGFRVLPEDVKKISDYRTGVDVEMLDYQPVEKHLRKEFTELLTSADGTEATIFVGDSKEGWVKALDFYFELITSPLYRDIEKIEFNFDSVRPKGARLKTFGGTASGYQSIEKMFGKIHNVMMDAEGELEPVDAMDVANIIGENVVVGGVRRTSEICLFSPQDEVIKHAKDDLYTENEAGEFEENEDIFHRRMSNNSLLFEEKPDKDELHEIIESIKKTGEPGFINWQAMKERREDAEGVNPCGEVILDDKQTCNLVTNNVMAFVEKRKVPKMGSKNFRFNLKQAKEAFKLIARAGLRMTLVDLELSEWSRKQHRDRLVGVSMTGWQDMVDKCELDEQQEINILKTLKKAVRVGVDEYAEELGIDKPLLSTTIKPEGTWSRIPTVSSGLHYSHSPYYIRRVRINSDDPLCKVAEELEGWKVKPEVGQDWETCDTKVIEFPVKTPTNKTKNDVSAIEQLENYKKFKEYYAEHNPSITVTVKEDEWQEVEEWIWENWDDVVAITLIPHSGGNMQLMPYEEIDEEEYLERKEEMAEFNPSLLQKYEKEKTQLDIENMEGCEGGSCPIR